MCVAGDPVGCREEGWQSSGYGSAKPQGSGGGVATTSADRSSCGGPWEQGVGVAMLGGGASARELVESVPRVETGEEAGDREFEAHIKFCTNGKGIQQ